MSRFGLMLGRGRRARGTIALLVVALLAPAAVAARPAYRAHALPPGSEQAPATDCTAAVGYNVNTTLPGYRVPDDVLGTTCVPVHAGGCTPSSCSVVGSGLATTPSRC
jgi:hypothetical protein